MHDKRTLRAVVCALRKSTQYMLVGRLLPRPTTSTGELTVQSAASGIELFLLGHAPVVTATNAIVWQGGPRWLLKSTGRHA